ncbi:MAG: methylated-DNA--[protein]-cysteine S-methyltransferase [Cyclobacteriaceae bacterium]
MSSQQELDYDRIEQAIRFINQHGRSQPSLDEIAQHVHLSPFHFQRLFTEWAGVSPKKYLQYITLQHAKLLLKHNTPSIQQTVFETGLSGSGRLHDLFVTIEAMTPATYKQGGMGLHIAYSYFPTQFGQVLVASTDKGICHLMFVEESDNGLDRLMRQFPKASFQQAGNGFHEVAMNFFQEYDDNKLMVKLHLKGTPFQLKIWEALLSIPTGQLTTYKHIAEKIDQPNASRAVGTAIGNNPIAFLIPCHRVIQQSGALGGYMWGPTRKSAMIAWESAKVY